MDRTNQIKFGLLQILADCKGYLLPDDSFFSHAVIGVRPNPPSRGEFEDARDALDRDGLIDGTTGQFDGRKRWALTDKGVLALRAMKN